MFVCVCVCVCVCVGGRGGGRGSITSNWRNNFKTYATFKVQYVQLEHSHRWHILSTTVQIWKIRNTTSTEDIGMCHLESPMLSAAIAYWLSQKLPIWRYSFSFINTCL